MTWHLTEDVEAFRAAADPHLAAEAARNTVLLTVSESARVSAPESAREESAARARYGWWTEPDGRVTGAFVVTPPHVPALGTMTPAAARALARVLPESTGVRGETETVRAFAGELPGRWAATRHMRLFELGELTPPDPAPEGRPRLAGAGDVPLAVAWMRSFALDIGETADVDYRPTIEARISGGRLHIWETGDGRPVSMASVSAPVAGQARVSPVYTPFALRGRGYAGAVTAAVTRAALDAGAARVLLFTDLANPTSNALYQRLGYRPVVDHLALRLT